MRPVFVDSEYGSWNVGPHLLATEPEKWANKSIVPKAVVLVHIWLTVQLLMAHGCRVLGIDLETAKCDLAGRFGAETVDLSKGEDPVEAAVAFSRGRGVDGVLITAATKSSQPVHQTAQMCRKRGRIVLVGVRGPFSICGFSLSWARMTESRLEG